MEEVSPDSCPLLTYSRLSPIKKDDVVESIWRREGIIVFFQRDSLKNYRRVEKFVHNRMLHEGGNRGQGHRVHRVVLTIVDAVVDSVY